MDGTRHWLDLYGSRSYRWQCAEDHGRRRFFRKIGLVEYSFDADGRYNEGRADMCLQLEVEARSKLTQRAMRERTILAWTCLRCKHFLLQARATARSELFTQDDQSETDLCFAIEVPSTPEQALFDASQYVSFLEDYYKTVHPVDFWISCQNGARVVDPAKCLSKLFVHPAELLNDGRALLRFLVVAGHEIVDGSSNYVFLRDFVHLLNQSAAELRSHLDHLLDLKTLDSHLPLPQEALYPPLEGSPARQRWFWLLTRILRHVRKPLPPGFSNPLTRSECQRPIPLSPTYSAVLDYSRTPPLNTLPCFMRASLRNTDRLHKLCREANASIGSGCFALAALIMMEAYELREPAVPLFERKPFISGFPLNPRAFFNHHKEPDSLMLAFCDGIILPFLPSSLDIDGRIRLLARQAHRQLASYQKRARPRTDTAQLHFMSSRGAGRVLANQYLMSVERADSNVPARLRKGFNPQGAYPMRPNHSTQTCGVSSVGRWDIIVKQGIYDLDDESKDFVADCRGIYATVRARDGEFLVGVGGADDGLWCNASIDVSTIDPALVNLWKERFEHVLDVPVELQKAKL